MITPPSKRTEMTPRTQPTRVTCCNTTLPYLPSVKLGNSLKQGGAFTTYEEYSASLLSRLECRTFLPTAQHRKARRNTTMTAYNIASHHTVGILPLGMQQ